MNPDDATNATNPADVKSSGNGATAPTSLSASEQALDLAKQRTLLALDNTLLAWIRTSLTLIAFGFSLSKFVKSALPGNPHFLGLSYPKLAGLTIMAIGFFGLAAGAFEYIWSARKLRALPHTYPVSLIVAFTISAITILLMIALAVEPTPQNL